MNLIKKLCLHAIRSFPVAIIEKKLYFSSLSLSLSLALYFSGGNFLSPAMHTDLKNNASKLSEFTLELFQKFTFKSGNFLKEKIFMALNQ